MCAGEKSDGADGVMTEDDCCKKFKGRGWGLSDGEDCHPCSAGLEGIDYDNFHPDEPSGILMHCILMLWRCLYTAILMNTSYIELVSLFRSSE